MKNKPKKPIFYTKPLVLNHVLVVGNYCESKLKLINETKPKNPAKIVIGDTEQYLGGSIRDLFTTEENARKTAYLRFFEKLI